jgi:hypothetical protein
MEPSAATSPPTFGRGLVDPHAGLDVNPPEPGHPILPDDDLAAVPKATGLDALRAELSAEVEVELVTLDVPTRPGYAVRYRCDVSYDELATWRKRSADKTKPGHLDEVKLAAIILANKVDGIMAHGTEVTDGDAAVTFASPVFLDLTGKGSAVSALRHFYGLDGHVDAAAKVVLGRSGFGDELAEEGDDVDPTKTSR